jgi:hypothetical protein
MTSIRGRKHESYTERPNSPRPKKPGTGEEQSQVHAHHVLWHQGDCSQRIRPGRPNSQFRILLWRFMVTAWTWKCAKTPPRTEELAVASSFTREFFTKNNMTVVLHPSYFSLFPRLKIKLKGCHYDTAEVIKAGSQALLNTLTELDFHDAFQNGRYIHVFLLCSTNLSYKSL